MRDSPEEEASEGDMDHGFGDIDAFFVVAHEAAPSCHPSEGPLNHPAARQHLEAWVVVDAPDDFDNEVLERRLVHELASIVGPVGKEMFQPRPAFADGVEDRLRAGGGSGLITSSRL